MALPDFSRITISSGSDVVTSPYSIPITIKSGIDEMTLSVSIRITITSAVDAMPLTNSRKPSCGDVIFVPDVIEKWQCLIPKDQILN